MVIQKVLHAHKYIQNKLGGARGYSRDPQINI